jgi:hypothetical protein
VKKIDIDAIFRHEGDSRLPTMSYPTPTAGEPKPSNSMFAVPNMELLLVILKPAR